MRVEVDGIHGAIAQVQLQDLDPGGAIGRDDQQGAVEAAGPAERGVDVPRLVGGAEHEDAFVGSPSMPSSSASSWTTTLRIAERLRLAALVAEGVELVEEQHAGRVAAGPFEQRRAGSRSLWPDHMSSTSCSPSEVKLAPSSPAMARARNVLPQPGGP